MSPHHFLSTKMGVTIATACVVVFSLLIAKYLFRKPQKSVKNKHVVITGGSSGIGKCIAILLAKQGAHVTILARNPDKLKSAEQEIALAKTNNQKITTVSVDVSDYSKLETTFAELESEVGPIYGLINCAGLAICGKVEDFTREEIKTLIDVNYLGTLYTIQLLVPKMKQRKEGFIVLTASQVALMGMFGYSVYSSCKFTLRGLAESLAMEVRPYGVSVTLALPPDTDTPGYEIENQKKPLETKLLSENGGIYTPEEVAEKMLRDILAGNFFSYIGFESFILTTLCVGMSPFTSFVDVIWQSLILGCLRLAGAFYVILFQNIVKKCMQNNEK